MSLERSWARECPRDQVENAFTPILRRLFYRTTGVLAVAFVDDEGECIDYCTSLTPYETKVVGAHIRVLIDELGTRLLPSSGVSYFVHIAADEREIVSRRVSEGYVLVVVIKPRALSQRLVGGIEQAVSELRAEASISVARWEPVVDSVRVETRDAIGWPYAPAALHDGERRVAIDDVLGRWRDRQRGAGYIYFRVRTADGEEMTLVHDRAYDRWERHREMGRTS